MDLVFDYAAKRAHLDPDKTALHEVVTGRRLTYGALDRNATRLADALLSRGLEPGDRVAVLCHNCAAFFELLFACGKARLVLVPLNWRQKGAELAPLLDDCGAKVLFFDHACADLAAGLSGVTHIPMAPAAFDALLAAGDPTRRFDPDWPGDGVWYMLYTSGTTGRPKAVMQTFAMALANTVNIGQAIDLTSADVTPNFLPLFHTAGINLHSLPTLICGGTVKILPKFDPEALLALIDGGGLSALLAVPAVYQALSAHPRFDDTDLSRVRSWASGGAALPEGLIARYAARGVRLCQGYGMTETGPTVFLMDAAGVLDKPASVGKPQLLTRIRIVDPAGDDVPTGTRGELLIKGPGVTPGYYNRPEATAAAITADGWLRSGDIACQDAQGYVYIVDRIKDMYISGGENVYPAEVEAVLITHPDILEAAVIGVPDTRWGEVGAAYLIPRPGATPDPVAVRAWCQERLATYKLPKTLTVVADFPRTPAGKVRKHLLRDAPERSLRCTPVPNRAR